MEKSRGLRSGFLAGQIHCLWMRGFSSEFKTGWSWNRESPEQGPGNSLKVLLGLRQQTTLQNIGNVALGLQFDSRGHEKQRGPPGLCPSHDRLRILASDDDHFLCGWRGSPDSVILLFTTSWMSNFFWSVNMRFGSVASAISWRISLHFWALIATWLAVSSWRCSILKGFTPRSSFNTMMDLLKQGEVAKVLQHRQGFRRSFLLVFLRSWGERTLRFLLRPGVSGLLELSRSSTPLNGFYLAVLQLHITFSTFVKLYHCISVYSHFKTNFWEVWYTWSESRDCKLSNGYHFTKIDNCKKIL